MLKQNPTYKYKTAVAASLVAASSLSLPAVVGAHAASDGPAAPQDDHHVGLVVPSDALQEEETYLPNAIPLFTRSRNSFPGLKCGTCFPLNATGSPVFGLRPIRGTR